MEVREEGFLQEVAQLGFEGNTEDQAGHFRGRAKLEGLRVSNESQGKQSVGVYQDHVREVSET